MNTTLEAAARQALEALKNPDGLDEFNRSIVDTAITNLQAALAEPAAQPETVPPPIEPPSEESQHIAAQCWCTPSTEYIPMNPDLAIEFARVIDKLKAAQPVAPRVTLELPEGDDRTAHISWSELKDGTLHLCIYVSEHKGEAVAWRMRDTGYRRPTYHYYSTKELAEADAARMLQSRDDGHLTDLEPLFTRGPGPAAPAVTSAETKEGAA